MIDLNGSIVLTVEVGKLRSARGGSCAYQTVRPRATCVDRPTGPVASAERDTPEPGPTRGPASGHSCRRQGRRENLDRDRRPVRTEQTRRPTTLPGAEEIRFLTPPGWVEETLQDGFTCVGLLTPIVGDNERPRGIARRQASRPCVDSVDSEATHS